MNKLPLDVIDAICTRISEIIAIAASIQLNLEQGNTSPADIVCTDRLLSVLIEQSDAAIAFILEKE